MVDIADVVVVGGGVLGCSTALHLAEQGIRVRLLERDGLCEATSDAGAGFLVELPFEPERAASRYGRSFYAELHQAGHDIGYRRNGQLFVAAGDSGAEWLRLAAEQPAEPGNSVVDAATVERLTDGVIAGAGVHGGLLSQDAAQVHAPKAVSALADRLRQAGGIIDTRRPVTGFQRRNGRVSGVETPTGGVECDSVVLAAGAWSNTLARDLECFLPIAPQVTSRIITPPLDIPATMPTLFLSGLTPHDPTGGTVLWVREHEGGLLWGTSYQSYPRGILVDSPVPDRFDHLPMDGILENLNIADRAAGFMPKLAHRQGLRIKHGVPCYTPDHRAVIGAVPDVQGLYILVGDNESGITHGPGYGKALAEVIVNGSSDLTSLEDWRPDRFGDRFTTETEIVEAMTQHLSPNPG